MGVEMPCSWLWVSLMVSVPPACVLSHFSRVCSEVSIQMEMETHLSILAWEIHRGAWQAAVHSVAKESDMA